MPASARAEMDAPRRRKTAAERRAQRHRAAFRHMTWFVRTYEDIVKHRGSFPSKVAMVVFDGCASAKSGGGGADATSSDCATGPKVAAAPDRGDVRDHGDRAGGSDAASAGRGVEKNTVAGEGFGDAVVDTNVTATKSGGARDGDVFGGEVVETKKRRISTCPDGGPAGGSDGDPVSALGTGLPLTSTAKNAMAVDDDGEEDSGIGLTVPLLVERIEAEEQRLKRQQQHVSAVLSPVGHAASSTSGLFQPVCDGAELFKMQRPKASLFGAAAPVQRQEQQWQRAAEEATAQGGSLFDGTPPSPRPLRGGAEAAAPRSSLFDTPPGSPRPLF